MNLGLIKEMILNDPTIKDDIPGFLKTVNAPTIKFVEKTQVIVEENVTFKSWAQLNGGDATEDDVQKALGLIDQDVLIDQAKQKFDDTVSAIQSGEITTTADLTAKLAEPLPVVGII